MVNASDEARAKALKRLMDMKAKAESEDEKRLIEHLIKMYGEKKKNEI
jgi:hypothetical protein